MAVTPPIAPPNTNNVSVTGVEDQASIAVPLSGTDLDGTVSDFRVVVTLPAHGVLVTIVDGVATPITIGQILPATGNGATIYFVPDHDWNGQTTFQYAARDNSGLVDTTPATATITVTPVNDPPTTSDTSASGVEDVASIAIHITGADVDGTVKTFTITDLPENGTLKYNGVAVTVGQVINAVAGGADLTFVPEANWNGDTTFHYAATDNLGATDATAATATITVTPVNDPPETADTNSSGDEDTPIDVSLMGSDGDGTVATFIIKSLPDPADGTLTYNGQPVTVGQEIPAADGKATLVFNPTHNWNGETDFDYASKDNEGLVDQTPATATITVEAVNDPPETNDTTASGPEDAASISVNLSGSDEDGTVESFTITTLPANGVLSYNGQPVTAGQTIPATGGTLSLDFKPNANWNGDTTFNYASNDDDGLQDPTPALAKITVTPVNDAPTTNDTTASGLEDAASIPVHITGADIDGAVVSFTVTGLPENGVLKFNGVPVTLNQVIPATGNAADFTFTPDANWNGDTTFQYASHDNEGADDTSPATATITVTSVNDPPETDNTSASGQEDAPFIAITLSGSDTDGTVSTFTIKDLPANGTLTDSNGNPLTIGATVTADGSGQATVKFVPNANWNGDTSFHYASNDNQGLQDPTPATASINVAPVNDAPDTASSSYSGAEDSPGIPVSLSGSDVDGSVVSFTINSLPAHGTLMYNGQPVVAGQVIPAVANGAGVTFVPSANWNGQTNFDYSSTDNQGAVDPTPGTITINVASVNDGPDTGNSSAQGIKGALNIGLNMTGTDPDGTVVSFTIKTLPTNGVLSDGHGHNYAIGDVISATNGQAEIFFTPTSTFTGTVSFQYASNDNGGAQDASPGVGTVVITAPPAAPDPKPPETNNVSVSGNEDVIKLPINLSGSDADGTVKSFTINDLPANGKLYDAGGNLLSAGSVVTASGNAAVVYFTPNANWNGDTSFHYSSKDNDNLVDGTPATAKIHINDVNDGPDTCDVTVCASSCSDYVKIGLAGSDTDGKVTGFVITNLPTDGVLKYGSTVLKVGDVVPANSYGQASVTFYPNNNWDGVSTFKYASKDDDGAVDTTPATATIKVAQANDGPETNAVTVTGVEDGPPVTIKITGTDTDGTVTSFKINSIPVGGVLKFGTTTLKVGDTVNATGNSATLTFTPNANWSGSTTFQYSAKDNDGATDSTAATAKITITGDNDGPSTKDIVATGSEDCGTVTVSLAGTDPDGTVKSFTITDLPANGVLKTTGGTVVTAGMVITATNNGATLYFTPNANWNGSTTFHYAAKDDLGAADTTPATAKITVTGVNDAPTTNATTATGTEDGAAVKITLSGTDLDGTVTSFKISSLPSNGVFKDANGNVLSAGSTVTASGGQAFVYFTPKANFSGETTFQYQAKDNEGALDGSPATGKIVITGVNDGPAAVNDSASVTAGTALKLSSATLLSNDTDIDGDKLTISSVQGASHGIVGLATDGTVTFTPTAGYSGAASFTYTISDGHGGSATATVNVDVKAAAAPSQLSGPGVHSNSWWCGTGSVYWDGETDAAGVKHGPTNAGYPKAELTYKVDSNADGLVDSQKFLLIGDFNKNGVTDNGEHTYLLSLSNAKALLGSDSNDARVVLGKDLVTAWLNYLAENPAGTTANANAPAWFVQEAVDWLSQVSGTTKTLAHGVTNSGGMSNGDFVGSDISTYGASWNTGINLDGASGIQSSGKDVLAGDDIHDALASYNTTGKIGASLWANDGGL